MKMLLKKPRRGLFYLFHTYFVTFLVGCYMCCLGGVCIGMQYGLLPEYTQDRRVQAVGASVKRFFFRGGGLHPHHLSAKVREKRSFVGLPSALSGARAKGGEA